jgi:two-component system, cell cycle response regulator
LFTAALAEAEASGRPTERAVTARLLVVDDVPANGRLLEARLNAEYYDVRTVNTARDVHEIAKEWQPDAILLDVLMPDIDGYEVCRRLKSQNATAHIPVVMVTALKEQPDRQQGLRVGADEFLSKPIEHEILLARLRGIIRLKQLLDEWRARGSAAASLGLMPHVFHPAALESSSVLIIDDLPTRALRMRNILAQRNIGTVLVQHDNAVLPALQSGAFDLIVLSLSLLSSDPLRLVARLRAAAATRDTPLLLIAAPDQRDALISGLDLGASDCLMLPLDEGEFFLRVNNHIQRKLHQDRLRSEVSTALELAVIDPLTQLYNRRYMTSHLERLCADPAHEPFAVLMLDVDYFKAINDCYGHGTGDKVLCAVADALRRHLRDTDMTCRYGGEEFLVVAHGLTHNQQALDLAETLRSVIEQMRIEPQLSVTVSIGVTLSGSNTALPLIDHADRALYQAKRQGRNTVSLYADSKDYEMPLCPEVEP